MTVNNAIAIFVGLLLAVIVASWLFAAPPAPKPVPVAAPPAPPALPCAVPVKIINVQDGDSVTLDLLLPWDVTLRNQKCRLIGFDAPEISRIRQTVKVTDEEIVRGKAARDALQTLLDAAHTVYAVPPMSGDSRDPYGRTHVSLRTVHANGVVTDVAGYMIANGHTRTP